MMKVFVVFCGAFISEWETSKWPPSIQMGITAGILLASTLRLKEMRYLVYIRYLCSQLVLLTFINIPLTRLSDL
jgi:hypothetical protein